MGIVILIILVVLCFGAFPSHSFNSNWGFAPVGIIGAFIIIVLALFILGRL